MRAIRFLTALLITSIRLVAIGQESQVLGRLDYYRYTQISEKLVYYGDVGARTLFSDNTWFMVNTRPSIHYRLNKSFELRTGVGLFYTVDDLDANLFELRPWQDALAHWPQAAWVKGEQRLRLEERFQWGADGSFSDAFRMRLRTSWKFPFKRNVSAKYFQGIARYEWFYDLVAGVDERYANRSRLYFGLGYIKDIAWKYELFCVLQDDLVARETQSTSVIIHFKVKHRLFRFKE
jgi:hypothetical protein